MAWRDFTGYTIMRIQTIANYQSMDVKSKLLKEKQRSDAPSKTISQDTFEPRQSAPRNDLINAVKKRIISGFYNTDTVLDDTSAIHLPRP